MLPPFFWKNKNFSLIDSGLLFRSDIDYPMITEEAGLPLTQKPSFRERIAEKLDPPRANTRDPAEDVVIFKDESSLYQSPKSCQVFKKIKKGRPDSVSLG